jgi:hypothetical protein
MMVMMAVMIGIPPSQITRSGDTGGIKLQIFGWGSLRAPQIDGASRCFLSHRFLLLAVTVARWLLGIPEF